VSVDIAFQLSFGLWH